MRIAATCFYALMFAASLYLFRIWVEVNAHLEWYWSMDSLSQSFLGMIVFSGFAAYVQIKSADFNEVLGLQYLTVGVLVAASWLSHAYPEYSRPVGFAHFLVIAGFIGWDLSARQGRRVNSMTSNRDNKMRGE